MSGDGKEEKNLTRISLGPIDIQLVLEQRALQEDSRSLLGKGHLCERLAAVWGVNAFIPFLLGVPA